MLSCRRGHSAEGCCGLEGWFGVKKLRLEQSSLVSKPHPAESTSHGIHAARAL